MRSNILLKGEREQTGLQLLILDLSPFLKIGVIHPSFNSLGKQPWLRHRLNVCISVLIILDLTYFSRLVDILFTTPMVKIYCLSKIPCRPEWHLTLYGPRVEFTVEKCFSCFFLILYISNVIKNSTFFPPQKLRNCRRGQKKALLVKFYQHLKVIIFHSP